MISSDAWRYLGLFLENIEKSPENLIITVKRSVYKAFRAFKYLNLDLLK